MSEHCVYHILRNPVYTGKVFWNKKSYTGIHEPIISEDLFFEAQSLTKEKIRKKRVYKEFLLSRLVKCSECGSNMTNTFTNKTKRRYYYYICNKVVKEGRNACSTKEVNAEKLEQFIFESLERLSKDESYIENWVYKKLRTSPPSQGFELSHESEKTITRKILHVLQRYVQDFKIGSQLEKQLVTKRTIEKIKFSKESMEVIVILEDRTALNLDQTLSNRLGLAEAKMREGVLSTKGRIRRRFDGGNPDAPACRPSSNKKLAERQGFEPWKPCGLHAFQACRFNHSRTSPSRRKFIHKFAQNPSWVSNNRLTMFINSDLSTGLARK